MTEQLVRVKSTFAKNYISAFSVALTFGIQYTFFPGVMFKYELSFFTSFSWFAISIVTFHSVCDTLGRHLGGVYNVIPKHLYPWACASRIIFVFFYMCTFKGVKPSIFGSDWFIITNFALFSVSCGYLSTIGMNYGSDASTKDQAMAGSIMGFHLIFGITAGSFIALLYLK